MPGVKNITWTLLSFRKAAETALRPKSRKLLFPPGQDLMDIALMPHIPDDLVLRKRKHIVKGKRELHRTEVGSQMSTVRADGPDQKLPDLFRKRRKVRERNIMKIIRFIYPVKNHIPGSSFAIMMSGAEPRRSDLHLLHSRTANNRYRADSLSAFR